MSISLYTNLASTGHTSLRDSHCLATAILGGKEPQVPMQPSVPKCLILTACFLLPCHLQHIAVDIWHLMLVRIPWPSRLTQKDCHSWLVMSAVIATAVLSEPSHQLFALFLDFVLLPCLPIILSLQSHPRLPSVISK